MNSPNQNLDTEELIRKALAPPPSSNRPPASNTPTPSKASPSKASPSKASPRKTSPTKTSSTKTPVFISKIVEWDKQKGFGYLRHQKGKIFLHRKDFSEHHKRPCVGDRIHYQIGNDHKGRRCAIEARHVNDGGKISLLTWICLFFLIAVPLLAWSHIMVINELPLLFLLFYLATINVITYRTYKSDKSKARAKEWRTSETELHFLELIGGWPAALLAQHQFRHKVSKSNFKTTYWMIVTLHLYLACDYIFNWEILKTIVGLLRQLAS